MKSFRSFVKGLLIRGETSDPSDNLEGSIFVNSTTNRLKMYLQSAIRTLVSEDQTQTLTNKTIDGDDNTVQDLALTSLKTNLTDASKFIVRDAAGIPISNTKDVPTGAVVGTSDSQTLTTKTIVVASNVVTTAASGNLAATELNAALSELQGDIDTRALNSDLTTHMSDTSTHGITSEIVGRTEIQTLTGKTIDGDDNTVQDLALTSLKTVLGDASKFIVRDASGIPVSNTKAVPTGVVVGDSDTQTLQNKTLDNTNTITVKDTLFTIQDDADTSKQLKFQASGISGSTTRTLTAPDANTTIVGTDATQTLSAKTFSDAPILAEIATPSTPASGFGKVYFKSDGFLYQLNDDGTETKVGAGSGGINYILNPDAESNAVGWATYADAAGVQPVNGEGGAPTITFDRSSSSLLRGTGNFLFTKDAANRQGEGVAYDMAISTADRGKVLQGSFDYMINSGTYADDDLQVYIIQDFSGTPVVLQPTPYKIKNHTMTSERFFFEFQAGVTNNNFRFVIHVASTSASAYSLRFDNFIVGPQAKLYGSPITDFNITTQAPSSAITNATRDSYSWRRVGDSVEVQGGWTFTGAGSLSGLTQAQILPSGLALDTTKIAAFAGGAAADYASIGTYEGYDTGVLAYRGVINYDKTNNTINFWSAVAGAPYFTPGSGDALAINLSAPILGWGSSAIMSSDADTRVTAFSGSFSQTVNNTTPTITPTVTYDTHSKLVTTTYTIPSPGKYKLGMRLRTASVAWTAGNTVEIYYAKNGGGNFVLGRTITGTLTAIYEAQGSDTLDLIAGDTIVFKAYTDVSNTSTGTIVIEKLQGPSQIMASETILATVEGDAASATSGNPIIFPTATYDTHGAYNVSTGKFTVPSEGYYRVAGYLNANTAAAQITLEKNDIGVFNLGATDSNGECAIYGVVRAIAGDTLHISPNATVDATNQSQITFEKI